MCVSYGTRIRYIRWGNFAILGFSLLPLLKMLEDLELLHDFARVFSFNRKSLCVHCIRFEDSKTLHSNEKARLNETAAKLFFTQL